MSRIWFDQQLECVATFWRIARRDGVTLGFTTHDRDLWFGGVLHRSAPGMIPSAIRRTADFEPDSAEVEGALSHDSIAASDLAKGRYDGAAVSIGLVDWETLEQHGLYRGTIGAVTERDGAFSAALRSRKIELHRNPVPRTSPTCRAQFCGPGCSLSVARFTHDVAVLWCDPDTNAAAVNGIADTSRFIGGTLRWLDGPLAGTRNGVAAATDDALLLDQPIDLPVPSGTRAILTEGCDRTLATCSDRFANACNFQGEPFLPGNDFVTRYPSPAQ